MNGDRLLDSDGELDTDTFRAVSVDGVDFTGLDVASQTDSDQFAGFLREQITYDGSTPVTVKVNDPWSKKTSTQHKSYADTDLVEAGSPPARSPPQVGDHHRLHR
jgi:hypothetical protein